MEKNVSVQRRIHEVSKHAIEVNKTRSSLMFERAYLKAYFKIFVM
jgi:hypothetical protein